MRVLWLSHVIPFPPRAGVLLRSYYLLKSVAECHETELIAFVQRPLLETFYPDVDAGLQESRRELLKHCRAVTFLPIGKAERPLGKVRTALESLISQSGYMASWLDDIAARKTIASYVNSRRFDVAHFDHISLAPYRPLLQGTAATLGHHNAESHMLQRRAELESNVVKKLYFAQEGTRLARYESRIAGEFSLHITCSELDSERLQKSMPTARFLAVPNGVDASFFAPTVAPQTADSLIFVGTMSWYPNAEAISYFLREVWPTLRAQLPTATFDIIGAGAPATVSELAVRSVGVRLHGYVPEIRPFIQRAALYVCPIRDGGGTKLKILDALAMGKCIVAHPIACEGIAVTPDHDVVFAETPAEFVAKIRTLLANPERRREIGAAARELAVSSYSFAVLGRQFSAALESVASVTAAPSTPRD